MTGPAPQITIERDGPKFRVVVTPPDALPGGWSRPETFSSSPLARMSAKLLAEASGFPVFDLTKVGA